METQVGVIANECNIVRVPLLFIICYTDPNTGKYDGRSIYHHHVDGYRAYNATKEIMPTYEFRDLQDLYNVYQRALVDICAVALFLKHEVMMKPVKSLPSKSPLFKNVPIPSENTEDIFDDLYPWNYETLVKSLGKNIVYTSVNTREGFMKALKKSGGKYKKLHFIRLALDCSATCKESLDFTSASTHRIHSKNYTTSS